MTNEKLIQNGHIWALAIFVSISIIGFATYNDRTRGSTQENTNSSSQSSQNKNSARRKNSNTGDTSNTNTAGEKVSMTNMTAQDKSFMMEAAMGGMMEVELGKLATQQGTDEAVKKFGQKMVDDHSAANSELTQLASTKGITLPTELDEKHRAELNKMSKLTGAAFDRAYSKAMLDDHKKDVAAFERQSVRASDPDLKAFAAKTLPTLKEHLTMAQALNAKPASSK